MQDDEVRIKLHSPLEIVVFLVWGIHWGCGVYNLYSDGFLLLRKLPVQRFFKQGRIRLLIVDAVAKGDGITEQKNTFCIFRFLQGKLCAAETKGVCGEWYIVEHAELVFLQLKQFLFVVLKYAVWLEFLRGVLQAGQSFRSPKEDTDGGDAEEEVYSSSA